MVFCFEGGGISSEGGKSEEDGTSKEEAPSEDMGSQNAERMEGGDSEPEDVEPTFAYYEAAHRPGRYPTRAEIGNFSDPGTFDYEASETKFQKS